VISNLLFIITAIETISIVVTGVAERVMSFAANWLVESMQIQRKPDSTTMIVSEDIEMKIRVRIRKYFKACWIKLPSKIQKS